jgi:hypothetical protein
VVISVVNADLAAMQRTISQLRGTVTALRGRYGDSVEVRRLANDLERLEIDLADLAERPTPPAPRQPEGGKPDVVVVPDTPYDPALWLGADDEGVGGVQRHRL